MNVRMGKLRHTQLNSLPQNEKEIVVRTREDQISESSKHTAPEGSGLCKTDEMRSRTLGSESNDSVLLLSLHVYFWISFHVIKV